jgi:hypothetical protein
MSNRMALNQATMDDPGPAARNDATVATLERAHLANRSLGLLVEAGLVAVAEFDRLVRAGRSTRRHGRTTDRSVLQLYFDLNGGIAATFQDFTSCDTHNGCHFTPRMGRRHQLEPERGGLERAGRGTSCR